MSASPLMALGMKGMAASYAGLKVTGHNIANASVSGFSRQEVSLTTPEGQFTGAGFFGRGVDVQSVTRAHDAFITREAAMARSLSAMDATRLTQLKRLEAVFKPGAEGVGAATSELMNAFTDLANRPDDMASRQVVLARARDLADRFSDAGQSLDDVAAGVASELRVSVSQINSLARSVADVNRRIAEVKGLGQPANDLLDERDRLLSRLSSQIQVTRMEASDGTLSVFVGGGQRLVLGISAAELALVPDASDPTRWAVAVAEGDTEVVLGESTLGGGAVAGLLRFQNDDLVEARALVGQLAASVGAAINIQQQRGLNLQPPLGTVASQPLFAIGPSLVQPHNANARDAGGAFVGSVSIAVATPAALQASEYTLAETSFGSGSWVLTRLTDGRQTAVVDGAVVDGMRITFGATGPQPGDSFRLQPVSRAANGFAALLSDPLDIAAAAPLVATPSPANRGTAAVSRLTLLAAPLPVAGATASINFVNDTGDYTWALRDAGGGLLAAGAGLWTPGGRIPQPPADINGFELQISGVPRNGDVLTVAPTPATALASNNGNATALEALRDARLTGGQTATEAWSRALADVGVRVQSGQSTADISQGVASQAEGQRADQSGVNLDEEAARLIQYQQSYQAAAKVLQVAQSLFQQLLDAATT